MVAKDQVCLGSVEESGSGVVRQLLRNLHDGPRSAQSHAKIREVVRTRHLTYIHFLAESIRTLLDASTALNATPQRTTL